MSATSVFQQFIKAGFTPEQAAGIVGNLMQESGPNLDVRAFGDRSLPGGSRGIAQWNRDRLKNLQQFGGLEWENLDKQVEFILHELNTTEKKTLDQLRRSQTIDDAVAAFAGYERPQGWTAENPRGAHGFTNRLRNAYQIAGSKDQPLTDRSLAAPTSREVEEAGRKPLPWQVEIGYRPRQNKPFNEMDLNELEALMAHYRQTKADEPAEQSAREEIERRKRWKGRNYVQNLTDPDFLQREIGRLGGNLMASGAEVPLFAGDVASGIAAVGETAMGYNDETSPIAVPLSRKVGEARQSLEEAYNIGPVSDPIEAGLRYGPAVVVAAPSVLAVAASMGLSATAFQVIGSLSEARENDIPLVGGVQSGDTSAAGRLGKLAGSYDPDEVVTRVTSPLDLIIPTAEAATVTNPTQTVGGPSEFKTEELRTLGFLGLLSVGMMFAPGAYRLARQGLGPKVPRVRQVETDPRQVIAPSGAETIERTSDLLISQVADATEGTKRILRRSGVDPVILDDLTDAIDTSTHAAGRALIHNALSNGRMDTIAGSFAVKMPLGQVWQAVQRLPQQMRTKVNEYIHLYNTLDDLRRTHARTIRGVTAQQARRNIALLEQAYPALKDIKTAYKENVDETIRFLSTGPYAILSKKQAQTLRQQQPNWAPVEVDILKGRNAGERAALLYRLAPSKTRLQKKPQKPLADDQPLRDPIEALVNYQYAALQARIENEITGRFIDAMRGSKYGTKSFIPVTSKQITQRPAWGRNVVVAFRGGKPERYWGTDLLAGTLKFDPYYPLTVANSALYYTKRMLETGTTGVLAPYFAPVQAWRDVRIGKITAPTGTRKPTYRGAIIQVPKVLSAKLAKGLSDGINQSLNTGTGGWFMKALGPNGSQGLSNRLAYHYHNSLVSGMERLGSTNVAMTAHQIDIARNAISEAFAKLPVPIRRFGEAWKETIDTIQNSGKFSYIARNWKKGNDVHNRRLMAQANRLTGDYRKGGQVFVGQKGDRLGVTPVTSNAITRYAPRVVGSSAELYRLVIPWANPMIQGMRRLGQAYVQNPFKFTIRMWQHVMAPAAASYFWAYAQGPEYVKHMMERRSDYNRTMNLYVAIPGRPPEEGVEIPMFHEMALPKRLMEVALDHLYRSEEQMFTHREDFLAASRAYLGVVAAPAMPPIIGAAFGMSGVSPPQNVFGGETFIPRKEIGETDFQRNLELVTRALAGSLADVVGSGYAAMNEGGAVAGLRESGNQVLRKLPGVGSASGRRPLNSQTQIQDELFKKQGAIRQLTEFFKSYGEGEGIVNTKPRSKAGAAAQGLENTPDTEKLIGLPPEPPTNPLYLAFMAEVYKRTATDTQSNGVKGFLSLWGRYGDMSEQISSLRKINAGNLVSWQERLQSDPELARIAAVLKVDGSRRTDVNKVINAYERARQDLGQRLLLIIKATEQAMSQRAGGQVRIEDLMPYKN